MKRRNIVIFLYIYGITVKGMCFFGDIDGVYKIVKEMGVSGCRFNVVIYIILIKIFF